MAQQSVRRPGWINRKVSRNHPSTGIVEEVWSSPFLPTTTSFAGTVVHPKNIREDLVYRPLLGVHPFLECTTFSTRADTLPVVLLVAA
eukprot:4877772-Pleurochrysis_carterae.AAC.1